MQDKHLVVSVGIGCLTVLESIALYKGLDGVYFSVVIGAISSLVGLCFGIKIGSKK